ncbi:hypothetical protein [Sphingomonas sp.]|uniref:hypothetical protein n=1 Tax=Sphingomonas sp. TaxID=28214 RepID=UPI00289F52FD|nr:hypothetical protein [Sphingomonas sp.]
MTDMPPTRFRVVERGRRLEVIDTQAPKSSAPAAPKPLDLAGLPTAGVDRAQTGDRAWLPTKIRFDGGSVWTTQRLYDAKGPRTLTLNAGTVGQMRMAAGVLIAGFIGWLILASFVPVELSLPLLLASGKTRATLRNGVTEWIDRLQSTQ